MNNPLLLVRSGDFGQPPAQAALRQAHLRCVFLGNCPAVTVPPDLRFQPTPVRALFTSSANYSHVQVTWLPDGQTAVFYRGAPTKRLTQILDGLGSPNARERETAARAAGWAEDPAIFEPLLTACRDADPGVARAAKLSCHLLGLPAFARYAPNRTAAMLRSIDYQQDPGFARYQTDYRRALWWLEAAGLDDLEKQFALKNGHFTIFTGCEEVPPSGARGLALLARAVAAETTTPDADVLLSLAEIGTPRAAEILRQATQAHPDSWLAWAALASTGDTIARQRLIVAVKHPDAQAEKDLIDLWHYYWGSRPQAADVVLALLHSDSQYLREYGARMAFGLPAEQAVPLLRANLFNPEAPNAWDAAAALGYFNTVESRQALKQTMAQPQGAFGATTPLANLGDDEACRILFGLAQGSDSWQHRHLWQAARLVGGNFAARVVAFELAKNDPVAWEAADSSFFVNEKFWTQNPAWLRQLAKASAPEFRAVAAEQMAGATPEDLDLLSALADDPDPAVREAAVGALMAQNPAFSLSHLKRLAMDDSEPVRWALETNIASLAAMGCSDAQVLELLGVIADNGDGLQWQTWGTLAGFHSPEVYAAMVRWLADPRPSYRGGAIYMSQMDVVKTKPLLLARLGQEEDPDIYLDLLNALAQRYPEEPAVKTAIAAWQAKQASSRPNYQMADAAAAAAWVDPLPAGRVLNAPATAGPRVIAWGNAVHQWIVSTDPQDPFLRCSPLSVMLLGDWRDLKTPPELAQTPTTERERIAAIAQASHLTAQWLPHGDGVVFYRPVNPTLLRQVLADLQSADKAVRAQAARSASWLPDMAVIEPLLKASEDPEFEVAYEAWGSCHRLGLDVFAHVDPLRTGRLLQASEPYWYRWKDYGDRATAWAWCSTVPEATIAAPSLCGEINADCHTVSALAGAVRSHPLALPILDRMLMAETKFNLADTAATGLVGQDSPAVLDLMRRLNRKYPQQAMVLVMLANAGDTAALDALVAMVEHPTPDSIKKIYRVTGVWGPPLPRRLILALTDSPDRELQNQGINRLDLLDSATALRIAKRLALEPDAERLESLLDLLVRFKGPESMALLQSLPLREGSWLGNRKMHYLARLGDPTALATERANEDREHPDDLDNLLGGYLQEGGTNGRAGVERLLAHWEDSLVSARWESAMPRFRIARQDPELLARWAAASDSELRVTAALSLPFYAPVARRLLTELARSPDQAVQMAVAQYLLKQDPVFSQPLVLAMVQGQRTGINGNVAHHLEQARAAGWHGDELLPIVEELLDSKEGLTRAVACRFLPTVGGPDAFAAMQTCLTDEDPLVREAAVGIVGIDADAAKPLVLARLRVEQDVQALKAVRRAVIKQWPVDPAARQALLTPVTGAGTAPEAPISTDGDGF